MHPRAHLCTIAISRVCSERGVWHHLDGKYSPPHLRAKLFVAQYNVDPPRLAFFFVLSDQAEKVHVLWNSRDGFWRESEGPSGIINGLSEENMDLEYFESNVSAQVMSGVICSGLFSPDEHVATTSRVTKGRLSWRHG